MKHRNPRPDVPQNAALVERIRELEADAAAGRALVKQLVPFAEAMARSTCGCAALPNGGCLVCQARDFVRDWKAAMG